MSLFSKILNFFKSDDYETIRQRELYAQVTKKKEREEGFLLLGYYPLLATMYDEYEASFVAEKGFYLKYEKILYLKHKHLDEIPYWVDEHTCIEEVFVKKGDTISKGDKVFKTRKVEGEELEDLIKEKTEIRIQDTEISKFTDDFSDSFHVTFSKVGGIKSSDIYLYEIDAKYKTSFLGLSFVNYNNNLFFISISILDNDIALAQGDKIIFLFENNVKIKWIFPSVKNPRGKNKFKENFIPITREILSNFLNLALLKVKVTSNRKAISKVFGFPEAFSTNFQYTSLVFGQLLLQLMTEKFIKYHLNTPELHDSLFEP